MFNVFAVILFLVCVSVFLVLILSAIGSAWSSVVSNTTVNAANNPTVNATNNTAINGTNSTAVNADDTSLQKLLAEYYNWNVNVPAEQLPEEGNQCVIKPGPINFLLDPFSKGTVSQTCDIKAREPLILSILWRLV